MYELTAQKFHELNQAYELLLDPLRRLALDATVRIKEARQARFATFDAKRKRMQEDLEEREGAFKKRNATNAKEGRERQQEAEQIKEEGRRMREEKEKEFTKKQEETEGVVFGREEQEANAPPKLGLRLIAFHLTLTDNYDIQALSIQRFVSNTSSRTARP